MVPGGKTYVETLTCIQFSVVLKVAVTVPFPLSTILLFKMSTTMCVRSAEKLAQLLTVGETDEFAAELFSPSAIANDPRDNERNNIMAMLKEICFFKYLIVHSPLR
jgi:hypothetical protein